jgi:hypothetical protein
MVGDQDIVVTQVKVTQSDIKVEGEFSLPPLAKLSYDDQVFAGMFLKVHGSIKEMEQAFGISYPTVKARLNKINRSLGFVETEAVNDREEILSKLERGEISVDEALRRMS